MTVSTEKNSKEKTKFFKIQLIPKARMQSTRKLKLPCSYLKLFNIFKVFGFERETTTPILPGTLQPTWYEMIKGERKRLEWKNWFIMEHRRQSFPEQWEMRERVRTKERGKHQSTAECFSTGVNLWGVRTTLGIADYIQILQPLPYTSLYHM